MKINEVKRLAENFELPILIATEEALLEELTPENDLGLDLSDIGECLTSLAGAIYVREQMEEGTELSAAVRMFTQRVRNSIN